MPNVEVVQSFVDPLLFLQAASNTEVDFCILDIEMPSLNGLELANLLQGIPVIFATGYKEYAIDAFEVNAVDFVSKPVNAERLTKAVEKVSQLLNKKNTANNFIQVNTDKGKSLIFLDQICCIKTSEIDSRDKITLLNDQSSIVLKNMSFEKLQQFLPNHEFVRINKKEIIAIRCIQHFSFNEITSTLLDSQNRALTFTLSEVYRQNFIEQLKTF